MKTKKLLPLALLPIGIIPLVTISCSSNETTYFEAEGLKISSKGVVMGYADEGIKSGPLEIKEEYNGVKIIEIKSGAFQGQKIDGLTLPKTLVKIGDYAFRDIVSPVANIGENPMPWDLSHLTNLEYIGEGAFNLSDVFSNPKKLNLDLNLSGLSKLKEVNDSVFYGIGLNSVDLRGLISLESIGTLSFGDNLISKIYWSEDNNNIKTIGSSAFTRNKLPWLSFVGFDKLENIGDSAFSANLITSILWNNSSKIKTIDDFAFSGNKLFGELDLHDLINLEIIGKHAFYNNKISTIIWPTNSQINNIDESAFEVNEITGELDLTNLINLKNLGKSAFKFNKISSIKWPSNSLINIIDESTFSNNEITGELDLTNLTNLTSIGTKAFYNNKISSIIWPTNSKINSIGLESFALNNFGTSMPNFPPGLTTETNGGISPEQIFTNKVRKLLSTN